MRTKAAIEVEDNLIVRGYRQVERKSRAKPRDVRRNLNAQESYSLGFTDFQENNNRFGWPYPDYVDGDE